ncbi:3-dehydroquinate synthase [Rubeoparvulum massiliense]|uniref:3-dehydroquinate synthase n=1 Tax=Rubeoparvulum massiliense TaxID=1631346 RepID=UPI00065E68C2|nr:3-dehydroquinate synthase [Rubeoparvulum massiliense]
MKELRIASQEGTYPIYIGNQLLEQIGAYLQEHHVTITSKIMVVTDSHVAPHYLKTVEQSLQIEGFSYCTHVVSAGEESKSWQELDGILTHAIEAGLDRHSLMLALGGGMIGDLTGFAASVYMRGIPFVQLPTTILAHDSSIGGKVAINHPLGKNLIGQFHNPLFVLYDTSTLHTLPARERNSGFAEMVKHGVLEGTDLFHWLEDHVESLLALDDATMVEALWRASAVKARIVAADPHEQGIRAYLNFGHTFGHAIEQYSHYEWLHGEAIAVGMAMAAQLAESRLGFQGKEPLIQLLQRFQLPCSIPSHFPPQELFHLMLRDKKNHAGQIRFVLPRDWGRMEITTGIAEEEVLQILQTFQKEE